MRYGEKIGCLDIRGIEQFQSALDQEAGVLIVSNHAAFADQYLLMEAADRVRTALHFMVAWQVFGTRNWFLRWALQRHGCFSIDREGADLSAFKQAVEILTKRPEPLVVFPEGDIYHRSEQVTPFRSGAAAIALSAARRADRSIMILPCALKYCFVENPTSKLNAVMNRIEQRLELEPQPQRSLRDRVYRVAERLLDEKETELLRQPQRGTLKQRISSLTDMILARSEARNGITKPAKTIPERIKSLRAAALNRWGENGHDPSVAQDLDAAFLAVQLFCYPGDYLESRSTIECLSETIDKLEEDVLGITIAKPKARRSAVLAFGTPIIAEPNVPRETAETLTTQLETEIQALLDGIEPPHRPWSIVP